MSSEVITAIISAVTTLIVSIGTWHVSTRNEREKTQKQTVALFESYRDELRGKMDALRDDVTQVNATVQQQISIVDIKLDTLSERVEKHNNVIDRTYKLEQESAVQAEQIRVVNHRIADLEGAKHETA